MVHFDNGMQDLEAKCAPNAERLDRWMNLKLDSGVTKIVERN